METDFLDKLDGNRNMVTALITEGEGSGYRCVLDDGKCIYESVTGRTAVSEGIWKAAVGMEKTCLKEINGQKVFFEVMQREPGLVICGGGHVSVALVKLAKLMHLSVTVLEDRPLFADHARTAGADHVICDSFAHALEQVQGDGNTYFVIMTRGHRYDKICLEAILKKEYAYIGMMGSRSRVKLLKQALEEEGYDRAKLEELHAPIGLLIGSETPEEIAVSVAAEIIQIKNRKKRSLGFPEEIREGLRFPGEKILATIIARKGSAPRQIGAKMVICPDGTVRGTIGGGCAEAQVIQASLGMLQNAEKRPRVIRVNMTNREAEEEGMVCGGIQDICLEPVVCFS